ncbi:cytochrome c oxidase subunit II [Mechercharimyces sp. CAU 1602]|uniref:cytochrome c oxidase subunit II n=1 Tax=Mechercharimyces sp. CAU 1602 TaxID=2973933 RepID=UPI002163717C|nr:cytochrome c oxidase subunit II [Mechercharimyces sp. CAU 1602]MCS1352761.1 cytochrome c oxidase subunit II [Mechercharimyces sp. CAU 1602]
MRQMKKWLVLLCSFLGISVSAGCTDANLSVLDPAGPVAEEQLWLMKLSIAIMVVVFLVVSVVFVYVVIRYREKPGDTSIPKQVEGSTILELTWTIIPIILLVILSIPAFRITFSQTEIPPKEESITINVIGHQYWWEYIYPDQDIRSSQDLHIPTGKKVNLVLRSDDVIHSYWAPNLGGKQNVIPGKDVPLVLQADKPGIYKGKCGKICGSGHALMNFRVVAQTPAEFDSWVQGMKNPKSKATSEKAALGETLFSQNCMGCHAVSGGGFKSQGVVGPDLTGFSQRLLVAGVVENNRENLGLWLENPQSIKPGNRMPAFEFLTDEQRDGLIEYLMNLK